MSSQRRDREMSVFSERHHRTSYHHGSQSSERSSNRKPKIRREDRFSSGYGSLSESYDSRKSIGKSRPPKANYTSQFPAERTGSYYGSESENVYESIPSEVDNGTFIHTGEKVSAVRFSSRCDHFSAPDLLLDGLTQRADQPFQAMINGRLVDYKAMSVLSRNDGKSLLIQHARLRIKLPTKVAKKCVVNNTEYEIAFRYQLLTQIETREIENQTRPYRGEKIRPSEPRSAWDYTVERPRSIQEHQSCFKVPGSEKVIRCKLCDGLGKGRCQTCNGAGQNMCTRCHGFAKEPMSNTECLQCGDGFETCHDCHGSGIGKCLECEGRGKVISYQRLKVNWTVKKHVYVDPIEDVPTKYLTQAKGPLIHRDVCDGHVEPITEDNIFHTKIVRDSAKQIAKYRNIRGTVCKQSQTVRLVLAQRFDCQYKDKPFSFYAIGTDSEVYVPYYPNRRFKFLDFFKSKR